MKRVYDITQEIFSCKVFPGDPAPEKTQVCSMEKGDICNLTSFSMCSHNGTHVDAPAHFIEDGKTIGEVGLTPYVGECFLVRGEGDVTAERALEILRQAKEQGARDRILLAGKIVVTAEAAKVFAEEGIKLLGNESQTVGPEDGPLEVHKILLGAEVCLLEGIVLKDVPEGKYLLCAAPLYLGECEGAPCRAVLIEE